MIVLEFIWFILKPMLLFLGAVCVFIAGFALMGYMLKCGKEAAENGRTGW